MHTYQGKRRKSGKKGVALVAAAVIFVLMAVFQSAIGSFSNRVMEWSFEGPAKPKVHLLEREAQDAANVTGVFAGMVFPPGLAAGEGPASTNDRDLIDWAIGRGGIPASGTGYAIQVSAPDGPIVITGISPRVIAREPPLAGRFVPPSGAGSNVEMGIEANLDETPIRGEPVAFENEWSFPVALGSDDNMFFTATTYTSEATVKWVLDVHYVVEGETRVVSYPEGEGSAFVTASTRDTTERWSWGGGWDAS